MFDLTWNDPLNRHAFWQESSDIPIHLSQSESPKLCVPTEYTPLFRLPFHVPFSQRSISWLLGWGHLPRRFKGWVWIGGPVDSVEAGREEAGSSRDSWLMWLGRGYLRQRGQNPPSYLSIVSRLSHVPQNERKVNLVLCDVLEC